MIKLTYKQHCIISKLRTIVRYTLGSIATLLLISAGDSPNVPFQDVVLLQFICTITLIALILTIDSNTQFRTKSGVKIRRIKK